MKNGIDLDPVRAHFETSLSAHGPTPRGVDWNSDAAQAIRFEQLIRLCDLGRPFSILDYGCGYGALVDFLQKKGAEFRYTGYDLLESMLASARDLHRDCLDCRFISREADLEPCDYAVASGVFNKKCETGPAEWQAYVLASLEKLNALGRHGFAFNLLTGYSDPEYMRPDLYYPDPGFFLDHCIRRFSRRVALLHDYGLYDFTILVRKDG